MIPIQWDFKVLAELSGGTLWGFNVAQMYIRLAEAIRTGQRVEPDFDSAVQRRNLLETIHAGSEQGRRVNLDYIGALAGPSINLF